LWRRARVIALASAARALEGAPPIGAPALRHGTPLSGVAECEPFLKWIGQVYGMPRGRHDGSPRSGGQVRSGSWVDTRAEPTRRAFSIIAEVGALREEAIKEAIRNPIASKGHLAGQTPLVGFVRDAC
jgi:hypothetical protein